ncbi:MAG: hypothetical protein IH831_08665 [Planctomycetes bacterium]|nr:hypothetical protein [Planctomycetota bacterium]
MRIDLDKAVMALNLLLEGMSVRATSRLTGMKVDTICDLILHVGDNCQQFLDTNIRGVEAKDVQVDEFCRLQRAHGSPSRLRPRQRR